MSVAMRTPQGGVVFVSEDQVPHALDQGYKRESAEGASADVTKEDTGAAGGVGGTIQAGVESAVSGATLGLSDVAANALFTKGDIKQSRESREAHPYVSMGGQIVGALATGGAGEGSLLAGTPAGYLAKFAGEGIEGARAVGGVKGALGVAAYSGLEGAAQSGGMYLSDTALGDRDLTAEGMAGALGRGFAFGSVAGGATYGLEKGTIAARRMFARTAEGGEQAAADAANTFDRKTDEVLQAHDDTAAIARKRLDEIQSMKAEAQQQRLHADSELANARLAQGVEPEVDPLGEIRQKSAQDIADAKVAAAKAQSQAAQDIAGSKASIASARAKAAELQTSAVEKRLAEKAGQKATKPAFDFLKQFETTADEGGGVPIAEGAGAPTETTRLERQLGDMKSKVDSGATLQDLNAARAAKGGVVNTEALLGPEVAQEEQKLTEALSDYGQRRAKVDEWIARAKNPRKSVESNATEFGAGQSNLIRARRSQALDEDVFVEQSGGQLRTIGKGEHDLADITPNSRILARSNGESFSKGAVLDDAYNDAVERARLAESPAAQDAALHEAADIEQQIHGHLRNGKPENGAVIDRIEAVRNETGRTGYHAAFARAERKAMDEAEATGTTWAKEDRYRPRPASTVADAHEASQVLGDYEKSAAELTEAVGDAAPPAAKDAADGYRNAESEVDRKHLDRTARAIDDHAAEQYGPVNRSPKERITDAKQQKLEIDAHLSKLKVQEAEARAAIPKGAAKPETPPLKKEVEAPPAAAPGKPSRFERAKGVAEKVGSGLELASMAGIPGIPAPHDIPIIGPLLGMYLKFRALTGKLTGRIPATAEAKAASLAASTRNKLAIGVDRSLGLVAKAAPAARGVATRVTVPVGETLVKRLFDDGHPDAPKDSPPRELAVVRMREISAAAQNPQGVIAMVRKQLASVLDPDLITASENHQVAKFQYLADNLPLQPPPSILGKDQWAPSTVETTKLANRVAVADDPALAFEQLAHGQITRETAETLRAVYPKLFAEVQQRLIERAPEVEDRIPYQQKLRMSLLYDVPLDRLSDPETIASLQSVHAPASQTTGPASPPQNQPPTPSVAGPVNLAQLFQPADDRRALRR